MVPNIFKNFCSLIFNVSSFNSDFYIFELSHSKKYLVSQMLSDLSLKTQLFWTTFSISLLLSILFISTLIFGISFLLLSLLSLGFLLLSLGLFFGLFSSSLKCKVRLYFEICHPFKCRELVL